ncbi:exopolysaccharide biosynthesis polyprenyl glycosylphosphotransferase [Prauserella marina]|uniref:Exopolysaccharide biosynthesis polyprenyl glycosylphosphotransferase n=1 Tax=Prauserella marina TaxID=530584 RepID=A0A222VZZ3_9PSEU|nr:sugar transferase [Prauserella marina]ASR39507.1 exopolysaccharide biosynthesis polyprenyl glycosylphosphotransferase [Prauserella marina]PWV80075.1 exopolysaccharide biosynthesis polyprenyl glycosylphosphotransferase [Prauserella marina]SDD83764.1 exopolysaccharide biosynthesis polyprenyl glycosylphosphotransferase [Prauserella marina]
MDESVWPPTPPERGQPRIGSRSSPARSLGVVDGRVLRAMAVSPTMVWERRYRDLVIVCDIVTTLFVVAVATALIGGLHRLDEAHALGTIAAVLCSLPVSRAWSQNCLGEGTEEFRRVGQGLLVAGVLVALGGLLAGALEVKPWVFYVVPGVAAAIFPERYLLRRFLHRKRRMGECLLPVIVAGHPDTVLDLIERTKAASHVGWRVEAVCTPPGAGATDVLGVPVMGGLDDLAEHVRRGGYRVVVVTADQYWTPRRLQQLAWDLEGTSADLVVAPTLMEIAGPRLNVSGVFGMPLLRVTAPAFRGFRRVIKEFVDKLGAALLLLAAAPVMAAIAIAVKLGDWGPVIYRQRRVGRDGQTFTMFKFRTMVTGAHGKRGRLTSDHDSAGPLFKMRHDPRVTRVGALLRRYSVDELPQLVNVLRGHMSLVGPRPPLPEETEQYAPEVHRKLLVKPGLTGLWQVSGRSELSWEESVRLDLRYVEDWSLALDMAILWKTLRAVIVGRGAY